MKVEFENTLVTKTMHWDGEHYPEARGEPLEQN